MEVCIVNRCSLLFYESIVYVNIGIIIIAIILLVAKVKALKCVNVKWDNLYV